MFFQSAQSELIEVSLDIIAKVCKEEDFSFAIPQKGMFQYFLKQKFMSVSYRLRFIKYKIQELNVFLIGIMALFN